jgi:hypothetical protein
MSCKKSLVVLLKDGAKKSSTSSKEVANNAKAQRDGSQFVVRCAVSKQAEYGRGCWLLALTATFLFFGSAVLRRERTKIPPLLLARLIMSYQRKLIDVPIKRASLAVVAQSARFSEISYIHVSPSDSQALSPIS